MRERRGTRWWQPRFTHNRLWRGREGGGGAGGSEVRAHSSSTEATPNAKSFVYRIITTDPKFEIRGLLKHLVNLCVVLTHRHTHFSSLTHRLLTYTHCHTPRPKHALSLSHTDLNTQSLSHKHTTSLSHADPNTHSLTPAGSYGHGPVSHTHTHTHTHRHRQATTTPKQGL